MKFTLSLVLTLAACSGDVKPLRATDVPRVLAAAASVAGASAHALEDAPGAECVVLLSAASALAGASEVIKGAQQGDVVFPAVHVAVAACRGWKRPAPQEAPAHVDQALHVLADVLPLLQLGPVDDQDACKVTAWLGAVVPYVADVTSAVLSEIQVPDGSVDVPARSVSVQCP